VESEGEMEVYDETGISLGGHVTDNSLGGRRWRVICKSQFLGFTLASNSYDKMKQHKPRKGTK
jgi:hypothetical protein